MSHLNPGLISAYNSLTDKHLTGYFNNARIRRHLQKVGLITRSGRIVPDKEYKHKLIQRAHQRHVRECLAQAIFHKVLDMERLHQTEIKRKLGEFARRERIHKMKAERTKRYEDEPMLMLSPRPPTRPKISHARHSGPEGEHSESTESPSSSRPNTAPGKMQRPVRLKPLNSNSATASLKRSSPRHRPRDRDSSNDTDQPLSYTLDRDAVKQLTTTDFSSTVSPYRLPVINNYVTPVPPLTKKKERGPRTNGTLRGRKLRPTTAPTAATEPSSLQRTSAQSKVLVSMVYFGKSVHLSHDLMDLRDEVKLFQQHCGGENLCVYKGKLREGEVFQFVSRRHQGFPFSLTFFLNGLQVDRLSSCCEFKHRKGARLGGRHGHFGFCGVEGASPCYKCIIAMGLDKKPTPPQKRVKEELPTTKSSDAKEEAEEKVMDGDDTNAEVNTESKKDKESLVQEPERHAEMLDTGNTDTEVSEMDGEGQASQTENGTETGAGDTERQRDADDVDQNIERRSNGQTDRDEREDLADEAEVDRSTGEMVQETDDKVDDGKVEDGEKSSEDKAEEEAAEKLEVQDRSESLGKEETEKPGDEETQDGEKENELEGGENLNAEEKENENSTEKFEYGVNDEHKEGEAEELSSETGNRQNESEAVQYVRTQGNNKEDDEQSETEDEQVRNKLSVEAEEEGQEKPNSEDDNGGETEKVKDKTMEDGAQKAEEEAEMEDQKIDEMAEGADRNCVENELETGEKLVEEPKKEVTDMNKISENTLEAGDGKEEAVSDENTAQKLEVNFEDQNEESVSQEEQNEVGSRGALDDDTEASTKEEVDEPAGVNNDLLDAENGERQDVSLEEAEKVEEYLQEETQGKSEGETTGDRAQEVIDDNEKPETDIDAKEEKKHDDNEQEIENKSDAELVPSERESQLGDEHEDQASDNQKADKEEANKESETSATTFIENVTAQRTQETINKDTENDIVSADAKAQEPNESELKGTDNELRSRDAPEVMDGDPVEPLERKVNSVNNDGGSSVSHSLKSQPVEKVKDLVLSIDSEDLAIHSEALTKAAGVDLVSNWINIHQESRYFQTCIEPLDEEGLISEETEERLNGEVNATDAPTSTDIEGLDETLKSGDEIADETPARKNLNENTESVVESLKTETKAEAIEADAHSNHSKDSIHTSTKDERVQEAGDAKGSLVSTWSRQSNEEQTNQKDIAGQETSISDDVINLGTTATSEDIQERAPSESEHQDVPTNVDLNGKESERSNQQNMTDETTHLSQTEEASNKETLESSEHNLQPEHVSQTECIEPQSPTITVITDLKIINKSENGSQDDTASVDFHSRQSDGNRRTKVIDGHLKQTLSSRDTLSTFSLDEARFFGPAGYPRLTTAHTENSY
uniref:Glutamate-rich protein 3-like n=1 Tax=Sinocyclocheilus grahami TaxID=75366 RepID=A0A672KUU3_SINGR